MFSHPLELETSKCETADFSAWIQAGPHLAGVLDPYLDLHPINRFRSDQMR